MRRRWVVESLSEIKQKLGGWTEGRQRRGRGRIGRQVTALNAEGEGEQGRKE